MLFLQKFSQSKDKFEVNGYINYMHYLELSFYTYRLCS